MDVELEVRGFLQRLRHSRLRGLLVVGTGDVKAWAEKLAGYAGGDCALVSPSAGRLPGICRSWAPPGSIERILGGEYAAAIIAVPGLLRPSIIAGAGETVRSGGFLAIVADPPDRWDPGPPRSTGLYREYLFSSIRDNPVHLWVDDESGRIVSESFLEYTGVGAQGWSPGRYKPSPGSGVPKRLVSACRSESQARALESLARFFRGRWRSALVRGDRGRGKSYVIGLALAYAAWRRLIGRAVLVGPTPLSVQSVMAGLIRGLDVLGLKGHRVVRTSGGEVIRVSGPWFRIAYEQPDTAEPSPLMVVDEAAAVGVARVRRLSWRSGKSLVATTIHGYEGSGRAFARLLPNILPKPFMELELREPIRYLPGDPLEEWLYTVFMLRAEPSEPGDPSAARPVEVSREVLARDREVLRSVYGILVQAHYRNTPDDLLAMLESPHHRIYALEAEGTPVAVADVVLEGPGVEEEARIALDRLLYMAGSPGSGVVSWRVSRIAVHEDLQRRGLGSRLLRHVEAQARESGASLVTTMFSRHDVIPFWLRNGFKPFYVSPRYNRVTGEKNVALAKPLDSAGAEILEKASKTLALKLALAGSSIYRDLAAEKLALLLHHTPATAPPLYLTGIQARHLEGFLKGEVMADQAFDAVYIALLNTLLATRSWNPVEPGLVGAVARVVQGKPYSEVASIIGASTVDEAVGKVEEYIRGILEEARSLWSGRVIP
ncbi:tRNA(Met) cytidine acetyltransferase TmcA [Aeropyrum pernix]|uniref:tRNA(Met) cytidine acetyltransferase TmcA n=1 Tax=Aeropyrum pernix TaxID=56636 RepID=A0A401H9S0_AERPX|nr:GNAT family N-acetyltransferase [Aeropyrum pernix]GBF09130.1 tRNA(Met) cytidine acetyltransferase TmcA [Aeropyrum pernix]